MPVDFSRSRRAGQGGRRAKISCHQRPTHLDITLSRHQDASMRTTVTLDKDVEQMLRSAMHKSRRSFKRTLNDAVRVGLGKRAMSKFKRFVVVAHPIGIIAGIDPTGLNKLVDELEADGFLEKRATHRKR